MSGKTEEGAFEKWIHTLPVRWSIGGLLIGLLWSLVSALLQGSFSDPVGGNLSGFLRVLGLILFPFALLGFVWGWSERARLHRQITAQGPTHTNLQNHWVLRQVIKAMICGALFAMFTYGFGSFRAFGPWNSADGVRANLSVLLVYAILAVPIGVAVGIVSRRRLRQLLSTADAGKAAG
jgi:hypothetical protein